MNKMFKNGFTLMEIVAALIVITLILIATLPITKSKLEKIDKYSYYMAYTLAEDIEKNVISVNKDKFESLVVTYNNDNVSLSFVNKLKFKFDNLIFNISKTCSLPAFAVGITPSGSNSNEQQECYELCCEKWSMDTGYGPLSCGSLSNCAEKCKSTPESCPPGMYWDFISNLCKEKQIPFSDCPDGTIWDNISETCISHGHNPSSSCKKTCDTGYNLNTSTCECVPKCKLSTYTYNPTKDRCEPICDENTQIYDETLNFCVLKPNFSLCETIKSTYGIKDKDAACAITPNAVQLLAASGDFNGSIPNIKMANGLKIYIASDLVQINVLVDNTVAHNDNKFIKIVNDFVNNIKDTTKKIIASIFAGNQAFASSSCDATSFLDEIFYNGRCPYSTKQACDSAGQYIHSSAAGGNIDIGACASDSNFRNSYSTMCGQYCNCTPPNTLQQDGNGWKCKPVQSGGVGGGSTPSTPSTPSDSVDPNTTGYIIYIDSNGDSGKGKLWKDVFPFYLTLSGKMIPAYDINSLAGANNKDNLSFNLLYDDYSTGNRAQKLLLHDVSFQEAACRAGVVTSPTYCQGNPRKTSPCDKYESDCRIQVIKPLKKFL